jgi:subtilisin family serine protease
MKHLYALILAALFCFTAVGSVKGQIYDPEFLDGNIYLKVKDTSSVIPDPTLLPALNVIFTTFGVDTIYKAFITANPLIDKIYRLEFSTTSITGQLLTALQGLSFVDYVEQVPLIQTSGTAAYTPNDLVPQQWYLNLIDAPAAWDLARGNSQIVVAIVDNAVSTVHEDLSGILWVNPGEVPNNFLDDDLNGYTDDINGYDVADYDNNPNPPTSGTGWDHGTHCSGIAAAETDNNIGIASVGFGIRVMAVKSSLSFTSGNTLERSYEGVDYAISAGAEIISMSWGGSGSSLTGQRIISTAALNGIVLLAAAGNNGDSIPLYPAAYSETICVGATNMADEKSSYSNFGSYIDVMAPGNAIYSSLASGPSAYGLLNGTSMACPIVAGLAGLLLSADPTLTPAQVKTTIENGCENIDAANPQYVGQLGAGRINAFNSLNQIVVSVAEPSRPDRLAVLYPNPTQGTVHLQINETSSVEGEIDVRDLRGCLLYQQTISEGNIRMRLDLNSLSPGIYLTTIKLGNVRQVERLIVK